MISDQEILKLLVSEDYISAENAKKAEEYAKDHRSKVTDYLFNQGIISNDTYGQAIAEFYHVKYANLKSNQPTKEQILTIPENLATKYHAVFFSGSDNELTLATSNPKQDELVKELTAIFPRKKISLLYALPEDIEDLLINYRKSLETRFAQITQSKQKIAPDIIDQIFEDAITFHASDIHLEPQQEDIIIRFRIDGVLQEAGKIERSYYDNILNRIKVMANLRLDEHYATQDGAIHYLHKNESYDMRISIVPIVDGEKVAIRLLAHYVQGFTLSDIGLSTNDQKIFEEVAKKPFGMILVTGPTGSGKTTTLYALLKLLNRLEVNITTIEDPVEYRIKGINQIQVKEEARLTFANGLRSIVRQDPNIILVGEVRDLETAEISVNAALTGHLLLSTFHANDAATAVPRLLDMKIEPFLLSSTLEVVVAQRLVRRICENCRASQEVKHTDLKEKYPKASAYFDSKNKTITLYQGKGCNVCNNTGFKGRMAIFEIILFTQKIKELVLHNPTSAQIWKLARENGSRTIFEDGVEKVEQGITTIEELLRVASPPES